MTILATVFVARWRRTTASWVSAFFLVCHIPERAIVVPITGSAGRQLAEFSLSAERRYGIDPGGPPRRQVAGEKRQSERAHRRRNQPEALGNDQRFYRRLLQAIRVQAPANIMANEEGSGAAGGSSVELRESNCTE